MPWKQLQEMVRMYRFELHTHTAECDKFAHLGGAELVRAYFEKGYSGMVVTDHYFNHFFDWFADELDGLNARGIIERWLKGYYTARAEGEKIGFTVLPGAEVRIDGTINDYLIFGLEERDFYTLPLLNRLGSIDEVIGLLPDYACVVAAHPFRNGMTVFDPERIFGIEVFNGGTEPFRNEMAHIFASHYGKAMTSGSDCHSMHAVGKGGIITNAPIKTTADLRSILKNGNYQIIY